MGKLKREISILALYQRLEIKSQKRAIGTMGPWTNR